MTTSLGGLGPPFPVISSSMGSPGLPATPTVGYGPVSSPQVSGEAGELGPRLSLGDGLGQKFLCHPQINSTVNLSGLRSVSSSDDVKPPVGVRAGPGHPHGGMVPGKRLCAICGDRSSGTWGRGCPPGGGKRESGDSAPVGQRGRAVVPARLSPARYPHRETLWGVQL